MSKKYCIKKYDGDDSYSYAIFLKAHVKMYGSVVFFGEASPVASGMSYQEAKASLAMMK